MFEQSKKLWKIEKVNKVLTGKTSHKQRKKKEADGNQRLTRDQIQRAASCKVRKKN